MISSDAVNASDEFDASDKDTEEVDTPYNAKELAALVKVSLYIFICVRLLR